MAKLEVLNAHTHERFLYIFQQDPTDYFDHMTDPLSLDSLRSIRSVYDYRCIVTGDIPTKRMYILGLGVSLVH